MKSDATVFVRPILAKESVLRRLPPNINPHQALFIDGIRHAVQIIDLAYDRLCETLTSLALKEPSEIDITTITTHAFLDAWAIVDAIDRFRMLCEQMPGAIRTTPTPESPPLAEVAKPLRNLRNVSDHLAQRAQYVLAHDGCALGTLTWFTLFEINPPAGWLCTLRPGTVRKEPSLEAPPMVITNMEWPTGYISLAAGGHSANLAEFLPHISIRVKKLEECIQSSLAKAGLLDEGAASDVFTKKPYQIHPDFLRGWE